MSAEASAQPIGGGESRAILSGTGVRGQGPPTSTGGTLLALPAGSQPCCNCPLPGSLGAMMAKVTLSSSTAPSAQVSSAPHPTLWGCGCGSGVGRGFLGSRKHSRGEPGLSSRGPHYQKTLSAVCGPGSAGCLPLCTFLSYGTEQAPVLMAGGNSATWSRAPATEATSSGRDGS